MLTRVVRRRPKWRRLIEKSRNAAYQLGIIYASGGCVTQDFSQAVKWYRTAAELGHLGAQKSLGAFYMNGWFEPPPEDVELDFWGTRNVWIDLDDDEAR